MSDFLLELRSEEIPARMQAGARAELERLFRREMEAAGVTTADVTVWSTPRRLALIARGLPDATAAVREEAKGPPEDAPDAALDGFCRKNGVTKAALELRDVKGRHIWFAVIDRPGRATKAVLADAIPAVIRDFAWPKSMRWGAASLHSDAPRWVRPLSGIVAILGEELVECEAAGVASGCTTLGHRFHHSGPITIGSAGDYAGKLRACHVIVDHEERAALIRNGAAQAAAEAGLTLVEDEGLVVENAGLTEWPVPLLGRFDEAFLDVPPEVIQLTARVNQKYFVLQNPPPLGEVAARSADGGGEASATSAPSTTFGGPPPPKGEDLRLANAFVCTANVTAADGGGRIVDGNRKVLAARLADARFFWEQDRRKTLAQHAEGLVRITFHEKLGTLADKVERVAKLARWLVEEGIVTETPLPDGEGPGVGSATAEGPNTHPQPLPSREGASLADLAEQAARLAKADLVTEMVGEFPELQGLMGGYYARAEGLPDEVADAIRDHYKPVGQGDEVPTAPVTVAVSLADKLDTLFSFFSNEMMPTGSKDPFALRRAGLAIISILVENDLRMSLIDAVAEHSRQGLIEPDDFDNYRISMHAAFRGEPSARIEGLSLVLMFLTLQNSAEFFADRLKVQQREAGVRHDLIDAVFVLGGEDDLVRLLARVQALQAFMASEDGANLLAGYKRAANILKKEEWDTPSPLQGRGRSALSLAKGAEGVGEAPADASAKNPHPPAPSPEVEGEESSLSYTPEPAEKALIDALDVAEPKAASAVEAEDFAGAMSALASLRAPIDAFFEEVTVNATEENKRAARLDLLARFRAAVHKVADFSRIEG